LPSFIDGYIEFWKYLRYLKTDNLAKMRTIAETAMYFSDCSQVPTSLWVEARLIYAKQLVLENEVY
jgi:hypothetical protein